MILSAEELEILSYLKSSHGKFVPMVEISRKAGGRRRFVDEPDWAKGLVSRLVDAELVDVNDRGHYRIRKLDSAVSAVSAVAHAEPAPADEENYFPSAAPADEQFETSQWFFPEASAGQAPG